MSTRRYRNGPGTKALSGEREARQNALVAQDLPTFRYHPDPITTGSVKVSSARCLSCEQSRGYIYSGPIYTEQEFDETICPWCIADGSAARRFAATFTDIGGNEPGDVPRAVLEEIGFRTPGFESWQQDHWLYHCADGCAFLGRAGRQELAAYPGVLDMLIHEHDEYGWTEGEAMAYIDSLDVNGDATAYVFRCLVCGAHLAFSDAG